MAELGIRILEELGYAFTCMAPGVLLFFLFVMCLLFVVEKGAEWHLWNKSDFFPTVREIFLEFRNIKTEKEKRAKKAIAILRTKWQSRKR